MRANHIKAALKACKSVIGTAMGLAMSPAVVRILANTGFDFLFLDTEHSHVAPNDLLSVVQMARACGMATLIRPQDMQYHLIANTLDTGADGLIVPRIETREQAERLVSYANFPPRGIRGCGTIAPLGYQPHDWREALPWLNEQSLIVTQIESMEAIENLDEIITVPGIDVIAVGPLDLSINLGIAGQFHDPKLIAAIDRVIATCRRHNMTTGIIMGRPDDIKPWWEKGMRFFSCSDDASFLLSGGIAAARAMRSFTGPA